LTLSARTESALQAATHNLERAIEKGSGFELSDIAYTLHTGRRAFAQRSFAVCRDRSGAGSALRAVVEQRAFSHASQSDREIAFLFPGGGAQYPDMGRELYQSESVYREEIDRCAQMLQPHLGLDIRKEMYPSVNTRGNADERLRHIALSLTTVFVTEYALAQLLRSWGILPKMLIGHSLGEYTAACLAGVFSLEDALRLVAARGRLMAHAASGAMLSLPLSEAEVLPLLGAELSLAANNGPQAQVVSGPLAQIEQLEARCKERGIDARRLHLWMGAHSILVEPILSQFTQEVAAMRLRPPQIPFISNVSGAWIREDEATSPAYWARHLRKTVRFADGLQLLLQDPQRILLEVGPGQTLRSLAAQHPSRQPGQIVLGAMRPSSAAVSDVAFLLEAVGKLWVSGGSIDWDGFHRSEKRRRVPLPTYPFERQPFWLEAPREVNRKPDVAPRSSMNSADRSSAADAPKASESDRFYKPVFRAKALPTAEKISPGIWLVLTDEESGEAAANPSVGAAAARLLAQRGERVVRVLSGEKFSALAPDTYAVSMRQRADYERLFEELRRQGITPNRILHLWNLMPHAATDIAADASTQLDRSYYSLLALTQALAAGGSLHQAKTSITVVTRGLFRVQDEPLWQPIQATSLGACLVLPKEYELLRCLCTDLAATAESIDEQTLTGLLSEGSAAHSDSIIAYRDAQRFVQTFEKIDLPAPDKAPLGLRSEGVYLITGGLGGIGLELAQHLAQAVKARLVLIGRSPPDRETAQRLQTIEAASGAVIMHATADVADRAALHSVVRAAIERFGRIDGVIHAAGVAGGGAVHNRRFAESEAVLRAKVLGTFVLDEVLKDQQLDRLDFMVFCSSLNAILGVFGQADYTAANAFLDAFAQHKQGTNAARYLSINWDAWRDIGMAGRAANGEPKERESATSFAAATAKKSHPLIENRTQSASGAIEFHASLLPQEFWPLNEHRLLEQPTLPSTAYLDAAVAAILASGVQKGVPIELHDVLLKELLSVADGQRVRVSTVLHQGSREWEFAVRSQADGESLREHCRGKIAAQPSARPRPPQCSLAKLIASHVEVPVLAPFAQSVLRPAQRWRCLRRMWRGDRTGVAELELDAELAAELAAHPLHPGLFDVALGFVGAWLPSAYLPSGYARVRFFAPLERQITSQVTYALPTGEAPDTLTIDGTIRDLSGAPLVEVVGLTLRRLHVRSR
jgi:acyl transferase domain-containing protein